MKCFLSIGLAIFVTTGLFSQINAVTQDGKDVILNNDGTWAYKQIEATTGADAPKVECEYTRNELDEFTGERNQNVKPILIGKDGLRNDVYIQLLRVGETLGWSIYSESDLDCVVKNKSEVMIKLANDEVLTFLHIAETDCSKAYFTSMFLDGDFTGYKTIEDAKPRIKSIIKKLKEQPIKAIRMRGEKYTDVKVSEKGANAFRSYLYCIGV